MVPMSGIARHLPANNFRTPPLLPPMQVCPPFSRTARAIVRNSPQRDEVQPPAVFAAVRPSSALSAGFSFKVSNRRSPFPAAGQTSCWRISVLRLHRASPCRRLTMKHLVMFGGRCHFRQSAPGQSGSAGGLQNGLSRRRISQPSCPLIRGRKSSARRCCAVVHQRNPTASFQPSAARCLPGALCRVA